jgi:hypothetical protein
MASRDGGAWWYGRDVHATADRLASRAWRSLGVLNVPVAYNSSTASASSDASAVIRQAFLVAEAYAALLVFDVLALRDSGFKRTYHVTRSRKVARRTPAADVTPRVCRAVEEACAWYFKRALCLQRSAVATW